jgi:hypothetical protein
VDTYTAILQEEFDHHGENEIGPEKVETLEQRQQTLQQTTGRKRASNRGNVKQNRFDNPGKTRTFQTLIRT